MADGTLAFRTHSSAGTDKTIGYALTRKWQAVPSWTIPTQYKPVFVISDMTSAEQRAGALHLIRNLRVLNVCGHRESDLTAFSWTAAVNAIVTPISTKKAPVSSSEL